MFSIIGAMAQLERDLIRERVSAGMRRAREKGKTLGRPRKEIDSLEFTRLRGSGLSMERIAQTLNISRASLYRNGNGILCRKKGGGNGEYHPLQGKGL